MCTNRLQ